MKDCIRDSDLPAILENQVPKMHTWTSDFIKALIKSRAMWKNEAQKTQDAAADAIHDIYVEQKAEISEAPVEPEPVVEEPKPEPKPVVKAKKTSKKKAKKR